MRGPWKGAISHEQVRSPQRCDLCVLCGYSPIFLPFRRNLMATPLPPDTPADISLFFENGKYVFRLETQSIYVYDRDKSGVPTCSGECAKLWRPVIASADAKPVGAWTLAERADRSK